MAWTIYDINQRTQFDSYQCGVHAILFAHLILALTADGPSNIAPLNRSTLTLNRRPEQTDNPTQLLVTLREYLVDLKPEGPKRQPVTQSCTLWHCTPTHTAKHLCQPRQPALSEFGKLVQSQAGADCRLYLDCESHPRAPTKPVPRVGWPDEGLFLREMPSPRSVNRAARHSTRWTRVAVPIIAMVRGCPHSHRASARLC